ncbi:MAG: DUF4340 domain-containing protein [Thermoguttaceae bacterium]
MRETTKTSIFIVLAILAVTLAVFLRPVAVEMKVSDRLGQPLFPQFQGASDVKTLEIIAPSAGPADVREFRLTESNNFWRIPSHDNYPADAKERMAEVVESLVDLKILEVLAETETAANVTDVHIACGVIDPKGSDAAIGEGLGTRVIITGAGGETFVDLIIGKKVRDDDANTPPINRSEQGMLRYVRIADQRNVYVVALDAARFSTNFGDWIEKNLLDINTQDVRRFYVDEYSIETADAISQGRIVRRIAPRLLGDTTIAFNPASGQGSNFEKWQLERMMSFRGANYEYFEEAPREDEELNTEILDAMLTALGDLKIVDVAAKPESLAAALRESKSLEELSEDATLEKYGFLIVEMPDPKDGMTKKIRMISKEGDFTITLQDGTQYILRFGEPAGIETDETTTENAATDAAKKVGMSRYLFITTAFDESSIPKPEPILLPELPTEPAADADDATKTGYTNAKTERDEIEKRNQREQDDYQSKLDAGRERVKKLNDRFAPWFYVISEDVYKKIHLDRKMLFRLKSAPVVDGEMPHLPTGVLPGLDGALPISLDEPSLPEPVSPEPALPAEPTKTEENVTPAEPVPAEPTPAEQAPPPVE